MMKQGIMIVMISLWLFVPTTAIAGNWYIGGGIESVSLGDDTDFVDNGGGLVFDFGYRFTSVVALDITLGTSAHEEDGIWDLTYARLGIGPKIFFTDGQFQPYFTVGIMSHVMDYDDVNYDIDGAGLFLGFGGDIYFDESNCLGIALISSTWDAEDNYGIEGDASTGIFRIVYNYNFK